MLSVYKLLKPPAFGNCSVLEESKASLELQDFRTIFSNTEKSRQQRIEDIKRQLDCIIERSDSEDFDSELLFDTSEETDDITDCVLYYLTGFISKKLFKLSKCNTCKMHLYSTTPSDGFTTQIDLTNIKSRGFLNHPNNQMFAFLKNIETILMERISSVNVFEETVDDILERRMTFHFPCTDHHNDIVAQTIYFYIFMRIQQFYKQQEKCHRKKSVEKRKESKLQLH